MKKTMLVFAVFWVALSAFAQTPPTDLNDPEVRQRIWDFSNERGALPLNQIADQGDIQGGGRDAIITTEAGVRQLKSPFYTPHATRTVTKTQQAYLGPGTWFQSLVRFDVPMLPNFSYVPPNGTPLRLNSERVRLIFSINDTGPLGSIKILVLINGIPKDIIDMRNTTVNTWYDMSIYTSVAGIQEGDRVELLRDLDGYNNGRTHNNSCEVDAMAIEFDSPDTFWYVLDNGIRATYKIFETSPEYVGAKLKAAGFPVAYISLPNGISATNAQVYIKQFSDHLFGYGTGFYKKITHSNGGPDDKYSSDQLKFDPAFTGLLGCVGIINVDNPWYGSPHSDLAFNAFQLAPAAAAISTRLLLGKDEQNNILAFVSLKPSVVIPTMQDVKSRYKRESTYGVGDDAWSFKYEETQIVGLIDPNRTGVVTDEAAKESGYPKLLIQYLVDRLNSQDAYYYTSNSTRVAGGVKIPKKVDFKVAVKWESGDAVVPSNSMVGEAFAFSGKIDGSRNFVYLNYVNHTSCLKAVYPYVIQDGIVSQNFLVNNRVIW